QSPADPARELPEIPLQPARHGAEVEDVSRTVDVSERIRRQVAHHGAPYRRRHRLEQPTADDAARAVGADQDAWTNFSPIGEDTERPELALDVDDLLVFLERYASLLHPRGEQRIKLASPHDRTQIGRAMVDLAPGNPRRGVVYPHVRHCERDIELAQALERVRNQAA